MWNRLKRLVAAFANKGASLGTPPPEVGVPGLAPCPDTPNCVSSRAADDAHFVDPISWPDATAIDAVVDLIRKDRRAELQAVEADYVHATYRIPVFGFIDDVEFLWDADEQLIHIRSASRLGRGDLGVNRRRVEKIRRQLRRRIRRR